MLRASKNLFRSSKSNARLCIFANQRANYFTDSFNENDKFTKELNKYPVITEGFGGEYAQQLFRHGFNTNQLGYIKLSLEEVLAFFKKQGTPLTATTETFTQFLKQSGVAPEVGTDLLGTVYQRGQETIFETIVREYNKLYNAHFQIAYGKLTMAEPLPAKYTTHLYKMKMATVGTLAPLKTRVAFTQDYLPSDLGGWRADVGEDSIDKSFVTELGKIITDEKQNSVLRSL
ncbi:hypothetical protein FDP41_013682 [Naegleria fowleri]|uniref:Uncharacterized protein n=1 Tax=Naegleria fowleri TaxID=5763 RepID=A0A6A5C3M7_NAEFO|nr:uncharacterized protein FDP41_013682 [Naegleria fowleri]KAF0980468.1 hypothetical protein FDP41_013682 [Naegleria fowleri]CAG4715924.1 unnamed protein product [Naegleria fowleri]